jgi:hypothetical protein
MTVEGGMSVRAFRLSRRSASTLAVFALLGLLCTACEGTVSPEASFKPSFLPFEISIGVSGDSTIEGNLSWATDIGEFSIGAKYELPPKRDNGIYVILRNRDTGYDKIYEVRTGEEQFNAIVNGTTSITVTNDQVLIDVTKGNIRSVTFKQVDNQIAEASDAGWAPRTGHAIAARWDTGWSQSWYKPYTLTKWAYGDSTIEKWYGVGFVWFLLRLLLAIILFFIDTVLTVGFLLGQLGFICFGPTGRDAIYGVLVLVVIVIAVGARPDY